MKFEGFENKIWLSSPTMHGDELKYITEAIRSGADIAIGHGIGPVNHGFNPKKMLVYDDK